MRKRLIFLIVFGLLLAPGQGVGDDFTRQKAKALQEARKNLIAKLSPAVIAVVAMADEKSFNPMRRFGGGGGSGVIIDPKGYALSNFHVTEYGPIKVGMVDGRLHDAEVIAFDEASDIVLIKIKGKKNEQFPYVALGDSSKVKVGDTTFAMGNPFGLATDYKPTTTLGILSGSNRYLSGLGNTHTLVYTGILQTDTPINPGNSGGPLFDRRGRLIGINGRISLARGDRKVNVGVGYAIPINTIKKFLPVLKRGRDAHHAILGISLADKKNVTVTEILPSSPASEAGLRVGDEILEIDGKKPRDMYEAIHMIISLPAHTKIRIGVKRASPLGNSLVEEAHYDVELKKGVIPMNVARNAKALKIRNFDFVNQDDFVDKKAGAVLEQILTRMRKINRDLVNRADKKQGLVWLRVIQERKAKDKGQEKTSRIAGDELKLFSQNNTEISRFEYYGRRSVMGISGFANGKGWSNSNVGATALKEKENRKITDDFTRRQCWFGVENNPEYSLGLKEESVTRSQRKCYQLLESFNGKAYYHYIDRISGLEICEESIDADGKVLTTTLYTKWGRLGDKIVPIAWETRNKAKPSDLRRVTLHKLSYGLEFDPLIFEYQPGVHF
jgi:S1-C subfamily serine protease